MAFVTFYLSTCSVVKIVPRIRSESKQKSDSPPITQTTFSPASLSNEYGCLSANPIRLSWKKSDSTPVDSRYWVTIGKNANLRPALLTAQQFYQCVSDSDNLRHIFSTDFELRMFHILEIEGMGIRS